MLLLPLIVLAQTPVPDTTFSRFVRGVPTVAPPMPGGVAALFRTIFNAPAWMWVIALVVGIVGAAWLSRTVWLRRHAIGPWLTGRNRLAKFAMVGAVAVVFGVAALSGTASWNYMQHENNFCSSCHVMEGPWNKFAVDAGKHSKLECHDCHQQSIIVSTRQLVLWVADHPEKIPPHAPVPNARCESCHNTDQGELWTRVVQTAGHRTHLESDSSALAKVMCVTCHGAEVHAFIPAKETCGSSGCHENLKIRLGKMAEQTALHCNQCHQFTAEVPLLATRDSAEGAMRPGRPQCLSCHAMERVLKGYDPAREPHNSTCGTCHNPHTQETPQAAGETCATSGCHANWRDTPFHTGTAHRKVGDKCLTCHQPHASKVDASDCVQCHTSVRERSGPGGKLQPPLPFDTTRVLRGARALLEVRPDEPVRGKGDVRPPDIPPPDRPAELEPIPADTFPHRRHTSLACITCHVAPNVQGGRLTFEAPRGCLICHHQPGRRRDCTACHRGDELTAPRTVSVSVTTPRYPPRQRQVIFSHPEHVGVSCADCHTAPVTLAATPAVRRCADCHETHHTASSSCADCHTTPQLRDAHRADVSASHRRCDACHTATTVAGLTPNRSFCVMCHAPEQSKHYPERECTTCHMLASPDVYRTKLIGGTTR